MGVDAIETVGAEAVTSALAVGGASLGVGTPEKTAVPEGSLLPAADAVVSLLTAAEGEVSALLVGRGGAVGGTLIVGAADAVAPPLLGEAAAEEDAAGDADRLCVAEAGADCAAEGVPPAEEVGATVRVGCGVAVAGALPVAAPALGVGALEADAPSPPLRVGAPEGEAAVAEAEALVRPEWEVFKEAVGGAAVPVATRTVDEPLLLALAQPLGLRVTAGDALWLRERTGDTDCTAEPGEEGERGGDEDFRGEPLEDGEGAVERLVEGDARPERDPRGESLADAVPFDEREAAGERLTEGVGAEEPEARAEAVPSATVPVPTGVVESERGVEALPLALALWEGLPLSEDLNLDPTPVAVM